MVTVRVPATTANLGPGFDTLGLALALYNTLTFEEVPDGLFFDGVEPEYATEENLAVIAYKAVLSKLGLPMSGLRVSISGDIPICRGLGSSAALIAAGAAGANANHGSPLSREELLAVCNAIEGHPDNLAPAIFGGLVASFVENGRPYIARYSLHRSLRCTALIPDYGHGCGMSQWGTIGYALHGADTGLPALHPSGAERAARKGAVFRRHLQRLPHRRAAEGAGKRRHGDHLRRAARPAAPALPAHADRRL